MHSESVLAFDDPQQMDMFAYKHVDKPHAVHGQCTHCQSNQRFRPRCIPSVQAKRVNSKRSVNRKPLQQSVECSETIGVKLLAQTLVAESNFDPNQRMILDSESKPKDEKSISGEGKI